MAEEPVLSSVAAGVATLTLNRPEKRNAIDMATLEALDEAVQIVSRDPDVRVVLLRGAGEVFSAGIDLDTLPKLTVMNGRPTGTAFRTMVASVQGVFNRLADLELPVVAGIQGACLGLALELVLAADIRVVEEGTKLGLPEMVLGLVPDCGGTTRLSRLVGTAWAKRLIFTGDVISAQKAYEIGMLTDLVPRGELDGALDALTGRLVRRSPLSMGLAKRVIDARESMDPRQQMEMERFAQSLVVGAPEFGEHLRRGIEELLAREPDRSETQE